MATLITGPSCSGKSTFIHRHGTAANVVYGFEVATRGVPSEALVHYNMLHHALASIKGGGEPNAECDFWEEPVFNAILSSGVVKKAIVIVTPIAELRSRMAGRTLIEPTRAEPGIYPNALWLKVLESTDLFACYERLYEALEAAGIDIEVRFSSEYSGNQSTPDFPLSDRVNTHHNLRGIYIPPPSDEQVAEVINYPGCEYQSVLLHGNRRTNTRGFGHVGQGRKQTFDFIRDRSLRDRSVLDVGCALGDMLFRAERFGATRLLGIELKNTRFSAAQKIRDLLHSRVCLEQANFMNIALQESFDDVLLLNIIHHVSDFRGFLLKAAAATKQRLIIEYPTLDDSRFQSLAPFADSIAHLPIVGVSSNAVDQTFVFTRAALERIIADAGKFESEWHPSPINNREILILHRKN